MAGARGLRCCFRWIRRAYGNTGGSARFLLVADLPRARRDRPQGPHIPGPDADADLFELFVQATLRKAREQLELGRLG